jgi:hypothetical protein
MINTFLGGSALKLTEKDKMMMNKMAFKYFIMFLGSLINHCFDAINLAKVHVLSLKGGAEPESIFHFFYHSKYPTNIIQTNRFRSGRLSDMLCPNQNDLSLTKLWFARSQVVN